MNQLRGLIKYQWLLKELVARDLKIKYRRSVLGYLWSILNPLLMMIVLTVVFSNMFRFDIENYPVICFRVKYYLLFLQKRQIWQ